MTRQNLKLPKDPVSRRRQSGNMLILGTVVMAVVGLGLLIGYSFGGLVFTHNRLQASADEIALAGARKLNDGDRVGQMNNLLARSRQLVFYSRKQLDDAADNYPQLKTIAEQLLDESRETAAELESERKKLRQVAQNEALIAMEKKFDQIEGSYPMSLPWLKVSKPKLSKMRLGRLENVESNVESLKNIPDLESYDDGCNFVVNNPGLKLYHQGVNAKLPGADSDLDFKICSLSAPVEKTVSPARVALSKAYQQQQDQEIATCCQVTLTLSVATGLGASSHTEMKAMSTAAATGASPQQ